MASAITTAWITSASASARRPAPSARATAEATPPPMPPADIVCISMTSGNTIETPASAVGAEPADEDGVEGAHRRLQHHDEHVGRRQHEQGARHRALEEEAGARRQRGGGDRGHRGDGVAH